MSVFHTRIALIALLALVGLRPASTLAQSAPPDLSQAHVDHDGLKKLAWQLLVQTTATGSPSIFESIDQFHAMVVHHIDLAEGQPVSPEHKDIALNLDMPATQAAALAAKVLSVHMDFVTLSVTDPMTSEAECRKVLELAKQLKVKRVVCQPTGYALAALDKLTDEYHVGISIVNQAGAGSYKDAASILAALQGHSTRISACADIAEFQRAGVVPLEAVRKLAGHLTDVRLSDVDAKGNVVEIGSGTADVAAILAEIKNQKFKGAVTLGAVDSAHSPAGFITSLNAFSAMVGKLASGG